MKISKNSTSKTLLAARHDAEKFRWHLCPPWSDKFNHDHWWNSQTSAALPQAALWEAMRRHPKVEQLHERRMQQRQRHGDLYELATFVGQFAFKTWQGLREVEHRMFLAALGEAGPHYRTFCTPPGIVMDIGREWDISHIWQNSHIPIAIDVRATPVRVAKWVQQVVKAHRGRVKPLDGGRAHPDKWLKVITKFEMEEFSRNKKKINCDDQLFAQYRRHIEDAWRLR